MSLPLLIGLCLGLLCAGFEVVRRAARRIDNFGVVDIAWTGGFAVIGWICAWFESGWPVRRWWIAAMVTIWSLRLGLHIALRVARTHPQEDPRYRRLRMEWAERFKPRMAAFFQLQAASVALLAAPIYAACRDGAAEIRPTEIAGTALWLLGLAGECLADGQLVAFKRKAGGSGVCDQGLWRYSRHPNYFFEWLVWMGYFVFASAAPGGWIGFISPLAMLYLLLRVTGIPLAEAQSLRSKGEAYRHYQRTTSAFIPWPRKNAQAP